VSVTASDGDDPYEAAQIAEAAREEHMTYPCFLDKGSVWQHQVGTNGSIPYFLVIGKSGRIIFKHHGKLEANAPAFAEIVAAIERAIAASS
jgi:hypothetical protein